MGGGKFPIQLQVSNGYYQNKGSYKIQYVV